MELFTNAGLSEQKAKETIKNEVVSNCFKQAIDQVKYFVHFFFEITKKRTVMQQLAMSLHLNS